MKSWLIASLAVAAAGMLWSQPILPGLLDRGVAPAVVGPGTVLTAALAVGSSRDIGDLNEFRESKSDEPGAKTGSYCLDVRHRHLENQRASSHFLFEAEAVRRPDSVRRDSDYSHWRNSDRRRPGRIPAHRSHGLRGFEGGRGDRNHGQFGRRP